MTKVKSSDSSSKRENPNPSVVSKARACRKIYAVPIPLPFPLFPSAASSNPLQRIDYSTQYGNSSSSWMPTKHNT